MRCAVLGILVGVILPFMMGALIEVAIITPFHIPIHVTFETLAASAVAVSGGHATPTSSAAAASSTILAGQVWMFAYQIWIFGAIALKLWSVAVLAGVLGANHPFKVALQTHVNEGFTGLRLRPVLRSLVWPAIKQLTMCLVVPYLIAAAGISLGRLPVFSSTLPTAASITATGEVSDVVKPSAPSSQSSPPFGWDLVYEVAPALQSLRLKPMTYTTAASTTTVDASSPITALLTAFSSSATTSTAATAAAADNGISSEAPPIPIPVRGWEDHLIRYAWFGFVAMKCMGLMSMALESGYRYLQKCFIDDRFLIRRQLLNHQPPPPPPPTAATQPAASAPSIPAPLSADLPTAAAIGAPVAATVDEKQLPLPPAVLPS